MEAPAQESQHAAQDPQSPRPQQHRAPALWLVAAAVVAACATAVLAGAQEGVLVLSATLVAAAVARVVRRGRLPEGLAVRSTTADVVVLLALAAATAVLSRTPGVAG